MAVAITRKKVDYILKTDRELPEAEQTIFQIMPLTAKEYAEVQDNMKFSGEGDSAKIQNSASYTLDVLKYGLKGWSNFKDENGQEIKFNSRGLDNLDYLSVEMRYELSGAIMELSILGENKSKNSD